MIAFLQPFGLSTPTGGARILRALVDPAPAPFFSVSTYLEPPPTTTVGDEVWLPRRPRLGRVERSRFARYLGAVDDALNDRFQARLTRELKDRGARGVHAVAQNHDFWSEVEVAQDLDLPYVLTIHDDLHHSLANRPELARTIRRFGWAWRLATARTVISDAMGEEYSRRYGERPYEVITDGVASLPDAPRAPSGELRLYYMGSMAQSYQRNFDSLFEGMRRYRGGSGAKPTLTFRGSWVAADPEGVPFERLPWASEAEVAGDIARIDVNYLPLPFGHDAWTRYSLSTKLVTYLGSGLPILYHGPADSAVARLLAQHDAAALITSLEPADVARGLDEVRARGAELAHGALALASGASCSATSAAASGRSSV